MACNGAKTDVAGDIRTSTVQCGCADPGVSPLFSARLRWPFALSPYVSRSGAAPVVSKNTSFAITVIWHRDCMFFRHRLGNAGTVPEGQMPFLR